MREEVTILQCLSFWKGIPFWQVWGWLLELMKNGKSSSSFSALGSIAGVLWLWLHKPFIEALLPPSCQANPLGWSAPLILQQENGTEDINQDYYTRPCSSQARTSYRKITS